MWVDAAMVMIVVVMACMVIMIVPGVFFFFGVIMVIVIVPCVLFFLSVIMVVMIVPGMLFFLSVIVVIVIVTSMILMAMVVVIVAFMVTGLKRHRFAEIVQDGALHLKKFQLLRVASQSLKRAFKPRCQRLPDPDHKVGLIKGLSLGRAHGVTVGGGVGGHDQIRRADAVHHTGGQGMNGQNVSGDVRGVSMSSERGEGQNQRCDMFHSTCYVIL